MSLPIKKQLTGYISSVPDEYGNIQVSDLSRDFIDWYLDTEEMLVPDETTRDSRIYNETFRVKIDKSTQFFNTKREYLHTKKEIVPGKAHMIIEIKKVYGPFNDKYGLVVTVYQIICTGELKKESCVFEDLEDSVYESNTYNERIPETSDPVQD
jgi:hypothetical protein